MRNAAHLGDLRVRLGGQLIDPGPRDAQRCASTTIPAD